MSRSCESTFRPELERAATERDLREQVEYHRQRARYWQRRAIELLVTLQTIEALREQ